MRNRTIARLSRWAAGVVAALGISSGVHAQESIEQRLDRLERANAELRQQLQQQQQQQQQQLAAPANLPAYDDSTVAAQGGAPAAGAKAPAKAPPAPGAPGGPFYEVGSDLKMTATWKDGLYLQTANKDAYVHVGGWTQYDNYWWTQSGGLVKSPGGAVAAPFVGPATGGIGNYQDGDYFRRVRLQVDGGFNEVFEFIVVAALENIQFSTTGLDECWTGISKVPVIGNIRAGHIKIAEGLEGDSYSSSKTMTFLEKSSITEAFYQNFGTGLWFFNSFCNDRVFYAAEAYRQDSPTQSGTNFGDGEYAYGGRLAALPVYENDGRCLVHLAASYFWRKAPNTDPNAPFLADTPGLRFRARPELRDNNPAGNPAGSQIVPGADPNRMVDTGVIPADSASIIGTEFLTIWGPASIQAEWAFATISNATGTNARLTGQDLNFNGGYVLLSYFLTGENRGYDTRLGRMASSYIQGGPRTPFWIVRGENGGLDRGIGAWELACRGSYLDLNDGNVQGGILLGATAGVNWYLTNNLKVQFQYQYNRREALPPGVFPGDISGFATRVQLVF